MTSDLKPKPFFCVVCGEPLAASGVFTPEGEKAHDLCLPRDLRGLPEALRTEVLNWRQHSTHMYAASLASWPAHGNIHRLGMLEDVVCFTCGEPRQTRGENVSACGHARLHPRGPS